jgi:hypothetical protein
LNTVRLSGAHVSIVARVVRQFEGPGEFATLERAVVLPSTPTVGTRLDLRAEGVEAPIEVIGVRLLPELDRPSFLQSSIEVFLAFEPLAAARLASARGWRDVEPLF